MKFSIRQHILFWTGYLLWDVLQAVVSMSVTAESKGLPSELLPAFTTTILTLPVKIIFSLFLFHLTLKPLVLKKGKNRLPVIAALFSTIVSLFLLRALILYIVYPVIYQADTSSAKFFNPSSFIITLFDLIIPACLLIMYELYRYTQFSRERENMLEKEKTASELNFLKAQINPHFLFNTLNNLYGLALKKSDKTPEIIMRLSDIMDYMLYESPEAKIPLTKDVDNLINYVEIEKIRQGNNARINFTNTGDINIQKIIPLLMLPLLENGFKHGINKAPVNAFLDACLTVTENFLEFSVTNNKTTAETSNTIGHGIGLQNLRRRLELFYPTKYELNITENNDSFSAFLKIDLT